MSTQIADLWATVEKLGRDVHVLKLIKNRLDVPGTENRSIRIQLLTDRINVKNKSIDMLLEDIVDLSDAT